MPRQYRNSRILFPFGVWLRNQRSLQASARHHFHSCFIASYRCGSAVLFRKECSKDGTFARNGRIADYQSAEVQRESPVFIFAQAQVGKTNSCVTLPNIWGDSCAAYYWGLLLLLLTSPLVTPLFARNPQSDLPACCRRSGKHHCADHMQMPASDGAQFMSSGMKCPMFPVRLATPGHSPQILPTNSQAFYGAIISHPAIHAQAEISYRICWSRSQQKRGPPVVA